MKGFGKKENLQGQMKKVKKIRVNLKELNENVRNF